MAHSILSPSSFHRTIECPGSAQYEEHFPNKSSEAALEGTAMHALCEEVLKAGSFDVDDYGGLKVEGFEITDERAESAQLALDYVKRLYIPAVHKLHTEQKLPLPYRETDNGTCDVIIRELFGELIVIDYKFGRRLVSAQVNPQLRIYALSAMLRYPGEYDQIRIQVIQPRINNYDYEVIAPSKLLEWADTTMYPAATRAMAENPPYKAGSHCLYCRAAPVCETLRMHNLKLKSSYPTVLDRDMTGQLLTELKVLEQWIKAVREHAFEMAKSGETPTAWKLVHSRTQRRWVDDVVAQVHFAKLLGNEAWEPAKFKSLAQVEKACRALDLGKIPDEMVEKPIGYTLVEEDDKRPAVSTAGDDFADVDLPEGIG